MGTVNGRGRPPKREILKIYDILKGIRVGQRKRVAAPYRQVKHVVDYWLQQDCSIRKAEGKAWVVERMA